MPTIIPGFFTTDIPVSNRSSKVRGGLGPTYVTIAALGGRNKDTSAKGGQRLTLDDRRWFAELFVDDILSKDNSTWQLSTHKLMKSKARTTREDQVKYLMLESPQLNITYITDEGIAKINF